MLKTFITASVCCLLSPVLVAQNTDDNATDTMQAIQLNEVVIIAQKPISDKTTKPLSTLDAYLEKANSINMVRRGSYAWEPFLNGMASERSVITIDGMRIYGACTDKMDPVTSYVELSNLSKVDVHNGQSGSNGATIAGGIDMMRKKGTFGDKKLKGAAFAGYESNNQQKIIGAAISYSRPRFYSDIDFTFRDAKNYKAGGKEEILYSQFRKYNVSAIGGYKLGEHQHIELSLIYDRAVDVGYPALPMDVSLASAFIGSVEYFHHHLTPIIKNWQTKIYFNDVTHIMDDTKRPIVPIRMDMPGWSRTAGFYSFIEGDTNNHNWKATLSGHFNRSLAEMTMFSNNSEEKDMFMYTWPGILTNYGDLFAEDQYKISEKWKLNYSAGIAIHNNIVNKDEGLESMRIFYPEMKKSKNRVLKRASASVQLDKNAWGFNIGVAYGERAPSVSEGYGFYLFNSFDRFDYIGNPGLKNEKSASIIAGASYKHSKFLIKLSASQFYIADYIIGIPHQELRVMTIGADGVKVYSQLKFAHIFNSTFDFNYQITDDLYWSNKLSYRLGSGKDIGDLPLIQPFTFMSEMSYYIKTFSANISVKGAVKQSRYNPNFGEKPLPAYAIFNMGLSNRFTFGKHNILLKVGAENLLDKYYTTFADWNRLPRMGRNFYVNVKYSF